MNLNESVLLGVIVLIFVGALVIWGYEGNQCKLEAIKAGMKADEVQRACR